MNLKSLVPFRDRTSVSRAGPGVFDTLHREIDQLFDDFVRGVSVVGNQGNGSALIPSMDVAETDGEIEITAELPGLERKDVEIQLDDKVLTIRGEKKVEADRNDKNKNFHVIERHYGVFYRVLELPPNVDASNVQASMSKGILKVKIPKLARSEAKKIEVKEAA
jgi:HSP20 family protein